MHYSEFYYKRIGTNEIVYNESTNSKVFIKLYGVPRADNAKRTGTGNQVRAAMTTRIPNYSLY